MSTDEAGSDRHSEQTTVLPETAAQLVELERLQQALTESEERAKSHWEQYLRAVADLDNIRKRAAKDIEAGVGQLELPNRVLIKSVADFPTADMRSDDR